jgi:hypothetical protein
MRLAMGLGWLGCVLVFAGSAEAAPPTEAPVSTTGKGPQSSATAEQPEYDDYRLSLVGNDAAAISMLVLAAVLADDNRVVANWSLAGSAATFALGGPIIHLVHEQPGRALGSFGLRVGLPVTGIALGVGMILSCGAGEGSEWCALAGAMIGGTIMLGGVVTAMIVDDGFLGRAPKPRPKDASRATSSFQASLAPLIDPKKRSLGLSLIGAF